MGRYARPQTSLDPDEVKKLKQLERELRQEQGEVQSTVEYPSDCRSPEARINHNIQALAELYDGALEGQEIGTDIAQTLEEVSSVLSAGARGKRSGREYIYVDPLEETSFLIDARERETAQLALLEMRLLTEVYRLIAEGDDHNLDLFTLNENQRTIQVYLEGVTFTQGAEAVMAEFRCEDTGIRLNVEYYDPKSGQKEKISTRMDYHFLRGQRRAHLNVDGRYISPTLRTLEHQDHLTEHFQEMDQETFLKLRDGVWSTVSNRFRS